MKAKSLRTLVLLVFMQASLLFAQNKTGTVAGIVKSVTDLTNNQALEKIYIHIDKPYYAVGDTLWFKAYLFNAAYLNASAKSGIAYIEIANEQNQVVKRLMVSMYAGLGWGNITLNEKEFPQGNYYLKAYTNWMRNFDSHYIFEKSFYISSPGEKDMLINAKMSVEMALGKQKARVKLELNSVAQKPVRLTDFQLKVMQGSKVLYKDKVSSAVDGAVDFNFIIPEKADPNKLVVTLQGLKKDEENPVYNVPVVFNRPGNIDLQFMPEGGALVADLESRVAFKALAEDGNGAFVSGSVFNSKQQEVLAFTSAHLGIGLFHLRPAAGETYVARLKLPDGSFSKPYPLPAVKSSGIILNVINRFGADSLDVDIAATADLQPGNAGFYLIGQSRGVACYGALIAIDSKKTRVKVSKAIFPTGIARLTLLNADKQPLNERIVYIDHGDHLHIDMTGMKNIYATRDSIGLDFTVTDHSGKPVRASFSVAVTDDGQVKNDSLKNNTLKSAILLTSDLKGYIEDPGYYFPAVLTEAIWQRLDNLLLTQGWVNYDWKAVFSPAAVLPFAAEANFSVKGNVTNVFNKPLAKTEVILLSKKPSILKDTVTDKNGEFNFTNIFPADTAVYLIEAKNKKGKNYNVGVDVEEFKPPVFNNPMTTLMPWYVNIDSSRIKTINNYYLYKKEQDNQPGVNRLKEVKIIGQKVIKDSKNLNGNGGSDFALDQEDLQKADKTSLGDLLKKYYPGFGLFTKLANAKYPPAPPGFIYGYTINFAFFHLIIDGINIDFGYQGPLYTYDHYKYVEQYLDYYKAEDIKGIEVMKSSKYTAKYKRNFLGNYDPIIEHAFVEVTTHGGAGPFLKKTPGLYMYRPMAFAPQKQFYSPKYIAKPDKLFLDTRSTIYWTANIITDKDGKARFSFYTADKPGTYTLLMDGCDMNGDLESIQRKMIVK